MSTTNNDDNGEQSDWKPHHVNMLLQTVGGTTWVHPTVPSIKATHLQPWNKLVISVDPEPYPDEDAPPSVPVETVDNLRPNKIEEALSEVDILPLLADSYTSLAYKFGDETTGGSS
jgi:hypothetical protein